MLKKVVYFPLVVFICYFFAFIRRLFEVLGNNTTPYWLAFLHIGFSTLLGLGNAIVYGAINSMLRGQLMSLCCKVPNQMDKVVNSDNTIQLEMELGKNDSGVSHDGVVEVHI